MEDKLLRCQSYPISWLPFLGVLRTENGNVGLVIDKWDEGSDSDATMVLFQDGRMYTYFWNREDPTVFYRGQLGFFGVKDLDNEKIDE